MKEVALGQTKTTVPIIGLGTARYFGGRNVLALGVRAGMRLIDTAESYNATGDKPGHTEALVGSEIATVHEQAFVATKISPQNLSCDKVPVHARASAARLRVSTIDLYQIHAPNSGIPILETMSAMERLVDEGIVQHIGVSNFSSDQLKEALDVMRSHPIVSNQIRYNLFERSVATDVLETCRESGVTVIAHTPLAMANFDHFPGASVLHELSHSLHRPPAHIMLTWLVNQENVIAIPKTDRPERVAELSTATDWIMEPHVREILDQCGCSS